MMFNVYIYIHIYKGQDEWRYKKCIHRLFLDFVKAIAKNQIFELENKKMLSKEQIYT